MPTIRVWHDDDVDSPRNDCGNICVISHGHPRSPCGDVRFRSPDEYEPPDGKILVHWPLYAYEHGGISLRLAPFHDPWDSGQVGWVDVTRERVKECYGWTRMNKERMARLEQYVAKEISVLTDWLNGQCFGYSIIDDDGEIVDSCGGFIGYDFCLECAHTDHDGSDDWEVVDE